MGGVCAAIAAAIPEIVAAAAEAAVAAGAGITAAAEAAGIIEADVVEFTLLEMSDLSLGGGEGFLTESMLEETVFNLSESSSLASEELLTGSGVAEIPSVGQLPVNYSLTRLGVSVVGLTASGLIIGGSLGAILGAVRGQPPKNSIPPSNRLDPSLDAKINCWFDDKNGGNVSCRQVHSRFSLGQALRPRHRTGRKRQMLQNDADSRVQRAGRSVLLPKSRTAPRRKMALKAQRMWRKSGR